MGLFKTVCMTLPVLLASTGSEAKEDEHPGVRRPESHLMQNQQGEHLQLSSPLRSVLHHPAFAGFARLLLPWDERAYDDSMPLHQMARLLPYHSHVHPAEAIAALNRLIDEVNHGAPVFYDLYSEAQKQAQPSKRNTGLFYFRGKPGAPFAVIAPGGGFAYVGSLHEGFPYAMAINQAGYNAFVLKYRVGQGAAVATEDLAAALSYIIQNAQQLGVSPEDYALWGSSAGARMVASIGSHGVAAFGGDDLPQPATVVMAYTGHTDHQTQEPPTFAVIGEQDGIASPATMARRVEQLRKAGTDVEFHRYPALGHGFGLGVGTSAEGWMQQAIQFWGQHIHSRRD
jgi:acetyl esterase/lipase